MNNKKQDRAWELLDAIGEANEGFVADAETNPKKGFAPILFLKQHMPSPRAAGMIAAGLVLAIALPVLAILVPKGKNGIVSQGADTSAESSNASGVSGDETEPNTSAVESNPAGTESSGSNGTSPGHESSVPDQSGEPSGDPSGDPSGNPSQHPDDPPTPPPVFASAPNLMEGIVPAKVSAQQADNAFLKEQMRFSLALFKQAAKGEQAKGNSLLLSPLSAQLALSMTANGARGQTREEMRTLLAGNLSIERLNGYLHTLQERLTGADMGCKVNIANALWYNEGLQVYKEFLQTNADYYGADAYQMRFDEEARKTINAWASGQTDGLIREAITEIDPEAAMYLLNAILFDGEWWEIYTTENVSDGRFTSYDGKTQTVSFMESKEIVYYEDGKATGFAKPYKGGKFAFVALLPNEGVDVYDYAASLTADGLLRTLQNGKSDGVRASLPKFSSAYETNLEKLLPALGMKSAFDEKTADFSGMITGFDGSGHLKSVNQKAVVSVGELGTKAAAVTAVVEGPDNAPEYEVVLNRPFVYMIVDTETNLPLFMGVQTKIDGEVPKGEAPEIDGAGKEPDYAGKDFTGLTVRLKDEPVTEQTETLVFLLENGSGTDYEYLSGAILLQRRTDSGWVTIPRLFDSGVLWPVAAGKTDSCSLSPKYAFGTDMKAGETYRVVFPGAEGLVCEFTVQ